MKYYIIIDSGIITGKFKSTQSRADAIETSAKEYNAIPNEIHYSDSSIFKFEFDKKEHIAIERTDIGYLEAIKIYESDQKQFETVQELRATDVAMSRALEDVIKILIKDGKKFDDSILEKITEKDRLRKLTQNEEVSKCTR